MTTAKAVFIDFDGTFADRGVIPPAHVEAVRRARSNGHKIFLCTGRPKSMLARNVQAVGFDGLVAAAGGYIEVDEQVWSDQRFSADLAARTISVLEKYDVTYVLEAPTAIFGPPGSRERIHGILFGAFPGDGQGPSDILASLQVPNDLSDCSFGKVTIFDSRVPVPALAEEIGTDIAALPSSITGLKDRAGELYIPGVDKSVGIAAVIARFGIDQSDVVAIGDGANDLEMLAFAGTAVAVEGSPEALLRLADLVIPGPDREGIVFGFDALGLTRPEIRPVRPDAEEPERVR
ncbi:MULTISPECIES: HAD hydrolase family protein [unclassified Cryobacterium]|uniref:HAD hydrolase family protein n=1 Tax=unclassified Cryobacterium TaxID=2649013 RepID=UPI00106A535A|nr:MULTISPECIES: HAD hydrolase family protein [unclassified Cryobacterium]TFC51084.1 HAD family phosphatase [Cryobacterium sp. TMB3-1-2]TFC74430.1 HAD family phosphatase [Cryobacterium sp. TMB3-15]TFC79943.1 HAD family phosphatase [Cryobacterium sp. TMB3-10]TFD41844.1 HAD family phosphatase [Cryobacterium sp. TMB3-12]